MIFLFPALNKDEEVLQYVFQYWSPPKRQIPPLLVKRVIREFGTDVLVARGVARTLCFFHGQYDVVARERLRTVENKVTEEENAGEEAVKSKCYYRKSVQQVRKALAETFIADLQGGVVKGTGAWRLGELPTRSAEEGPWLLCEINETERLKEFLSDLRVFYKLSRRFTVDLLRYWRSVGLSAEDIVSLYMDRARAEVKELGFDLAKSKEVPPLKEMNKEVAEGMSWCLNVLRALADFFFDMGRYHQAQQARTLINLYIALFVL